MTNSLVDSIGMISNSTIGQTINNYVLERKLGEGGMGDVYLARHNRVDRVVAIKILHQNLFANETIRTRFKNEANALIKLAHPNIIKIYDYVEQEAVACLIVEYFDGITLDDYINKLTGPIPSTKAIRIFGQVLDAVQYAHGRNILHRDIKPGNIMVSRDGNQVRIMDFGIAKLQDAVNLNITHANIQLGTPFYMSPEQVKGLPYTMQSDIYSLGITLFEMVTGKCPYSGITNLFELQSKIVSEPLPSTEAYYPNVPVKVQEAIKTATYKNSSQRFTTCVEFKKYLEEEKKEIVPATPKPIPQVLQKEKQVTKKKSYAWVWVFTIALVAIGGMAYSILETKSQSPTTIKKDTPVDTTGMSRIPDTTSTEFTNSVRIPQTLSKVDIPTLQKIINDLKGWKINVPETAQIDTSSKDQLFYATSHFEDKKNEHFVWARYKIQTDRYSLDSAYENLTPKQIIKTADPVNPSSPSLGVIIDDVKALQINVPEKRKYTHSNTGNIFTGILRYEDEKNNYILTVKYEKKEHRYNLIDHELIVYPKPPPDGTPNVRLDIVKEIKSMKKFRGMAIYPERNIEVNSVSAPIQSEDTGNITYDVSLKIDDEIIPITVIYYPVGSTFRLKKPLK